MIPPTPARGHADTGRTGVTTTTTGKRPTGATLFAGFEGVAEFQDCGKINLEFVSPKTHNIIYAALHMLVFGETPAYGAFYFGGLAND
jgi:hypothetical protein